MKKKLPIIIILVLLIFCLGLGACTEVENKVSSIELISSPKLVYVRGQEFDFGDAQIKVKFNNNEEQVIMLEKYMLTGFNSDLVGKQFIVITYKGKSTTISVEVVNPNIDSIQVSSLPNKVNYIENQPLSLDGAKITINYVTGTPDTKAITKDMVGGYNSDLIGDQILTVTYGTKTATFTINVATKVLNSIEINTFPKKTIYYLNDKIDATGGKLFLRFNNNYPQTVDMTTLQGIEYIYDFTAVTEQSVVTIKYNGHTTTFTVSVRVKNATSVEIITPIKDQLIGTELDLTGAVFKAFYNNNTSELITLGENQYVTIEGYDKNKKGEQTLTLKLKDIEFKFKFVVNVLDKVEKSLKIIQPDGEKIYQDTRIAPANSWKYIIVYNNGTESEPFPLKENMMPHNPEDDIFFCEQIGNKTIKIVYQNITIDYTFEVLAKTVSNITTTGTDNITTYRGEAIDPTGMQLKITYINGEVELVDITPAMFFDFNNAVTGKQTVTVKYSNKYSSQIKTTFDVLVVKKAISIGIVPPLPGKLVYIINQPFNTAGLKIAIIYEGDVNPEFIEEFNEEWKFSHSEWQNGNMLFTSVGEKDVYIQYKGINDPNQTSGVKLRVTVINNLLDIQLNDTMPTQVTEGTDININGINITAMYQVGSKTIALTKEMLNYNSTITTIGSREVIVTYTEEGTTKTASFNINVVKKIEDSIRIQKLPSKLEYLNTESILDTAGIIIDLIYNNGTFISLTLPNTDITFEGFSTANVGNNTITVGYKSFTTSYVIQIVINTIKSATWIDGQPSIEIGQGHQLDLTTFEALASLTVKIQYTNGESADKLFLDMLRDIQIEGYNPEIPTTQIVKLNYFNSQLSLTVKVIPKVLTQIEVSSDTIIPEVIEFSQLDLSQARLKLIFENGSESIVPILEANIVKSLANNGGYNKEDGTIGQRTVTITYTYMSVTLKIEYTITVKEKTLVSVSMKERPKDVYIEGDVFSRENGSVELRYDNNQRETYNLSDAQLNNSTADFNINNARFDSTEFFGISKLQTIYITVKIGNVTLTTYYDIFMHDRKYAEVHYNENNIYTFYYGSAVAPTYNVSGVENVAIDVNRTKLTYEDRTDIYNVISYSQLPTAVGRYTIVVSYDANTHSDRVHNSFKMDTKELVIERLAIYVKVDAISKIYGTNASDFVITYLSEAKFNNPSLENDKPFAYNQTELSQEFLNGSILNIKVLDKANQPVGITTDVGVYDIILSGIDSHNYKVNYVNAKYTITRREVNVIAESQRVEYGTKSIVLNYTTGAVPGKENTGLFREDKLSGMLMIGNNSINVGDYTINSGTITDASNPNYKIVFSQDKIVTVYQRDLYVKITSYSRIYGQDNPIFTASFFRDSACTDADAFAYPTDKDNIGSLIFNCTATILSNANSSYAIGASGLSSLNYNIKYINGTLDIEKRPVSVIADSKWKIFGTQDPQFTFIIGDLNRPNSGMIDANNDGIIDLLMGDLNRIIGEEYGHYTILIGNLAEANPNYAIEFVANQLTIDREELVLTIDDAHLVKEYNGKLPKVNNYNLSYIQEGNLIPYTGAFDKNDIEIKINQPRKDVGSYEVVFVCNNSNYIVKYPEGKKYYFEIRVKEVDIDFVNLPNNEFYQGSAYLFSAKVRDGQLQKVYNDDGIEVLDGKGNPLYDVVDVTLSRNTARDVGTYETKVTVLSNTNYRLKQETKASFSIAKRPLIVNINNTVENALYKEYTGQIAIISASQYSVSNSVGENVAIYVNVVGLNNQGAPSNVRFDPETNKVIGYDIEVSTTDPNYSVQLAENYKYVITQKSTLIKFTESFLSKPYDNSEPYLDGKTFIFSPSIGLTQSKVIFNFTRKDNEVRPNTDVGDYKIDLYCDDKNFSITLAKDYTYKIIQAKVKVDFKAGALSKQYDGLNAPKMTIDKLSIASYSGSEPIIKTDSSSQFDMEFQFALDGSGIPGKVGTYNITLMSNDYNRKWELVSSTAKYVINKKKVTLVVNDINQVYGDQSEKIAYTFKDGNGLLTGDTLDGSLYRDRPTDFNVGDYAIIGDFGRNENYEVIYFNTALYHITKATLTVTTSSDIKINGNRLVYGNNLYNNLFDNQYTLTGFKAAIIDGNVDDESVLSSRASNFIFTKNGTVVDIIGSTKKPQAGTYTVRPEGFGAKNYNFSIISGSITIAKAELKVSRSAESNVSRDYGMTKDQFLNSLEYIGFITAWGDSKQSLGSSFKVPNITSTYDAAFNLNTGANTGTFLLTISQGTEEMQNYQFATDTTVSIKVDKKSLILSIQPTSGNMTITTTYGTHPEDSAYRFDYQGFVNGETIDSLGLNNASPKVFWDDDNAGIISYKSNKISTSKELDNYKYDIKDFTITVEKKEIIASISNDISMLWNSSSGANIPQYYYTYNTFVKDAPAGQDHYKGQYKIDFTGFAYDDGKVDESTGLVNFAKLFEMSTQNHSYQDVDKDNKPITVPIVVYMPKHTLTNSAESIGEGQKIGITGIQCLTGRENYSIKYEERNFNVYCKVKDIVATDDNLVLEGDDIDKVKVKKILENGTEILTSASELTINTDLDYYKFNVNQNLKLTFNGSYAINEGYNNAPLKETIDNTIAKTLPFRIYSKKTIVEENVSLSELNDNFVDASNSNKELIAKTNNTDLTTSNYDKISFTLRVTPITSDFLFKILVNGDKTNGIYVYMNTQSGKGSMYVSQTTAIDSEGQPIVETIEIGNIDVFDGFSHDITILVNKMTKALRVVVDGNSSALKLLRSEFTMEDQSSAAIIINYCKAWVSDYTLSRVGYYDNNGIALTPGVSSGVNNNATFILDKIDSIFSVNAKALFRSSKIKSTYDVKYYYNGLILQNPESLQLGIGNHLVEMVIMDSGTLVDKYAINIVATLSRDISLVKKGTTNNIGNISMASPGKLYGYDFADTNDTIMNAKNTNLNIYNSTNNRPTSLISLAFTMQLPTFNNAKVDGLTLITLKGNVDNFNPFAPTPITNAKGIQLAIKYNAITSAYETRLYFVDNATIKYVAIDTLNYTDKMTTVNLIIDKASEVVSIKILQNSILVYEKAIDSLTVMSGGSTLNTSLKNILVDGNSIIAFGLQDSKLNIQRINIDANNAPNVGYYINGKYVINKDVNDIKANSYVTLADADGYIAQSLYHNIGARFTLTSGSMTIFLASTSNETSLNSLSSTGRGIYLSIEDNKLIFGFYRNGVLYKKQEILSNSLAYGTEHTVVAKIGTTPLTDFYSSKLISDGTVEALEVTFIIDDVTSSIKGYLPYKNSHYRWWNNNDTVATGSPAVNIPLFLPNARYFGIIATSDFSLASLEVSSGNLSAHITKK